MTLEKGILNVGVEIGYPPFEYYDSDGKTPLGFDISMAKALAGKLGLEVKFTDTAWDGIFAGVVTNKYDCAISSITITDERKKIYNFTRPYINSVQSVVTLKKTSKNITRPQDLNGLKVGYQGDTVSGIYAANLINEGIQLAPFAYDKIINCFDDLTIGRIDAIICDSPVAIYYGDAPDSPFITVWQEDSKEQFGICINKNNTALTEALDKALYELFADGTMKRISEDTFKIDMVSATRR
jgi:polar amino acid transport system substrate-binding protein